MHHFKFPEISGGTESCLAIFTKGGAADARRLDGHTSEWYVQPQENILPNGDYRSGFLINQRRKTVYTGAGYTVDGLLSGVGNGSVAVGDGFIELSGPETWYAHLFEDWRYADIPLTFTILTQDGVLHTGTNTFPSSNTDYTEYPFILDSALHCIIQRHNAPGTLRLVIRPRTKTVRIVWEKLEVGTHFTGFCPSDPAAALAKCQRYQYLNSNGASEFVRAAYASANVIYFDVPVPVTMRVNPVVESFGTLQVQDMNGVLQPGFTFSCMAMNGSVRIGAQKTAHGLTDAHLHMASVLLNANI